MSDKLYVVTQDQLFHMWHKAHSRGVDICLLNLGIDTKVEDQIFRDYLATLTPEPGEDVVERSVLALKDGLRDWDEGWGEDSTPTEDLELFQARRIAPIITAEVERRVSGYLEALERVERLSCEALANPGDNDTETLVAIATTVNQAIAKGANTPATPTPSPQQHDPDDWPEPGMEENR